MTRAERAVGTDLLTLQGGKNHRRGITICASRSMRHLRAPATVISISSVRRIVIRSFPDTFFLTSILTMTRSKTG